MRATASFVLGCILFGSCSRITEERSTNRFDLLGSSETGIQFSNKLNSTDEFNIYTYRNFYNGGGVGIGDVNNDGLQDIYLTANMESNRLYINQGDFHFKDVTDEAGVAGKRAWATGVSMVDINADGWLDIYVCNSGDVKGANKQNEFFINNGDGTFSDRAEELGLADEGFSTHMAFFDYDKDGDLDAYLLNNSFKAIGSANLMKERRTKRDPAGGDKIYRNDGGHFKDVSEEAGIYGSFIGFGLGISVTDLNKDGWLDLYISNDFFERDYIYMNNGDGTFTEDLENQMRSLSIASMGSDAADLNGDTYPDIFVTEMLPESEERLKTLVHFESWDKYQYNVDNDYYHQFMRNMLHIHNGISPHKGPTFTEIGRLAGVEATDWSWGALILDMDNDGYQDIFVSNGIYQDIIDQDYLRYISNEAFVKSNVKNGKVDFERLIEIIPSSKVPNYAFAGSEKLNFSNKAEEWGLGTPSHSNGSAYGDLDNDGDLDLVVNNVNMPVFIYRNNTDSSGNYLKVVLNGDQGNRHAIGSNVTLKVGDRTFFLEQSLTRGFQSSVDPRLNFGLGQIEQLDSVIVKWHHGGETILSNIEANQTLVLDATASVAPHKKSSTPHRQLFQQVKWEPGYQHEENHYIDFQAERMLYHIYSTEGPEIAVSDVNKDGLDDFYIAGARKQPGRLFIRGEDEFVSSDELLFNEDRYSEDGGALFFDADNDGDPDLYVCSGGSEPISSRYLADRLYLNDGVGGFSKAEDALPVISVNASVVTGADFDGDDDVDLFVGVRMKPGSYGIPQTSHLLVNNGKGTFTLAEKEQAPHLDNIGMVTDATWVDYDQDADPDLFIVGEWMAPVLLQNNSGTLVNVAPSVGLDGLRGWWNVVETDDLNQDGYPDFVVGNYGLNSRFRASTEKPITCYINDYDQNGAVEQIITQYIGDEPYLFPLLHDLWAQMPSLKKKLVNYKDYKKSSIEDLFSAEQLAESVIHQVTTLASIALLSDGAGGFQQIELPGPAQFSPVYAIAVEDFNADGYQDILLGGNLFGAKPDVGRYDANYGVLLSGDGTGNLVPVSLPETGLYLQGQVRDFQQVSINGEPLLMVSRNDDSLLFYKSTKQPVN